MPKWIGDSDGKLNIIFLNKEDLISFIESVVKPCARNFGLEVKIEEPKKVERKYEVVKV
jgi:hypothetical protein